MQVKSHFWNIRTCSSGSAASVGPARVCRLRVIIRQSRRTFVVLSRLVWVFPFPKAPVLYELSLTRFLFVFVGFAASDAGEFGGGLVRCRWGDGSLSTVKFWDTDPSTGPTNSWTIHGMHFVHLAVRSIRANYCWTGLWPDKFVLSSLCHASMMLTAPPFSCDGSFSEDCDASRDYTDIAGLLTAQGASDTLSFMEEV